MGNVTHYVPILKWKKGEQDALKELETDVKDNIIPLIEITTDTNLTKFAASIKKSWDERLFYFDVSPECYDDYEGNIYFDMLEECPKDYTIPVVNLSDDDEIFESVKEFSENGIAIRIFGDDFELIEDRLSDLDIIPSETDLIIDLKYLDSDDLYSKKSVLKSAVNDIDSIEEFRSIIVASNSFPEKLVNIEINKLYQFTRHELDIFERAQKLADKLGFNLIYSDYGPFNLDPIDFIPGMIPAFKVRYTAKKEYLFVKGLSTKKGGLDAGNICDACQLIVDSGHFCGSDYSWGDRFIDEVLDGRTKCGNLTTWVQVAWNHHISFVTDQFSNLP